MPYYESSPPGAHEPLVPLIEPLFLYHGNYDVGNDALLDAEVLGDQDDVTDKVVDHIAKIKKLSATALPTTCKVLDSLAAPQYASIVEPELLRRRSQCEVLFRFGYTLGVSYVGMCEQAIVLPERPKAEVVKHAIEIADPIVLSVEMALANRRRHLLLEDVASTWTNQKRIAVDRKFSLSVVHGFYAGESLAKFSIGRLF